MRQNFLFLLLTLTLITACGDKENTKAIPSLKGSETSTSLEVTKKKTPKITFNCKVNNDCDPRVALVAIQYPNEEKSTCLGAFKSTDSLLVHESCFTSKNTLEDLLKCSSNSKGKITITTLSNDVTSTRCVRKAYSGNSKLYLIRTDLNLIDKYFDNIGYLVENNHDDFNRYYITIEDNKVTLNKSLCRFSNLLLSSKTGDTTRSEYLDVLNCKTKKGELFIKENQVVGFYDNSSILNAICVDKCNSFKSKRLKTIKVLSDSKIILHKAFSSLLKKEDFKGTNAHFDKVSLEFFNGHILAHKKINCISTTGSFSEKDISLKYKITKDGEFIFSKLPSNYYTHYLDTSGHSIDLEFASTKRHDGKLFATKDYLIFRNSRDSLVNENDSLFILNNQHFRGYFKICSTDNLQ